MNDEEIEQTRNQLSKLVPGYLPEPLFLEFARLSVTGILELVPLRKNSLNNIEVLVLKRPSHDPHWPDMLHTPGTILRPTDSDDLQTAFFRVFKEIDRDHTQYFPKKVNSIFHSVKRGKELSLIYAVLLNDLRGSDNWISLSEIETKIVDTQIRFIQQSCELLFD